MALFDYFGIKKLGSLDVATESAEKLAFAVNRWAPRFKQKEEEALPFWIGTGVAAASHSAKPEYDEWAAVAILETHAVLKDQRFRECWQHVYEYLRGQSVSFAVLEVGSVNIAAGAVFGGSVGVPGGRGGTLGGAITAGSDCVALTAGHVVSPGQRWGIAEQPAASVGYPRTEIGHVIGWSSLRRKHNTTDLGLIRLHPHCDSGERSTLAMLEPGNLTGMPVRKTGNETGTTSGQVTLISANDIGIRHGRRRKFFDGLIGIEATAGRFAWFGDSGALVLPESNEAVGMVVAVSATGGTSGQPLCWVVGCTAMSATINDLLQDSVTTEA